jgi:hypothetical protein
MVNILTNIGEEWYSETNINGVTVQVALYNDTNDALSDSSVLADITEPAGSNYARESSSVTTAQIGSDYGLQNDSNLTFDTSDSSMTVDAAALIVNFQSDTVNGDGSAQDHLIAAGDLSQSRDLSQVDEVNVSAGDVQVTID